MHEYDHGLGFQNVENEATGALSSGLADIFSTFTYDNTTGKRWAQMTAIERQASALNYGNVVFDGASATVGAGRGCGRLCQWRHPVWSRANAGQFRWHRGAWA